MLLLEGSEMLPIFIDNSKLPVWLSRVSPIEIGSITIGPLIFSRGISSERTRRHEAIHWEQYKECLIVGFLILYLAFWLRGLLRGLGGSGAYYDIPFEREAYNNDHDLEYLENRRLWAWRKEL